MTYEEIVELYEKHQSEIEQAVKDVLNNYHVPITRVELDLGSVIMGEPYLHLHAELDESTIGEENGE